MKIQSQRMDISPLTLEELKVFIDSNSEFEKKMGCHTCGAEFQDALYEELSEMIEQYPLISENKIEDYLFFTMWVMIERESKSLVGQFYFNGKPNPSGEVEVFFCIDKKSRRKGYGTEAMEAILCWAKESKSFSVVLIEADFDNNAAMASLRKLGFKRVEQDFDEQDIQSTKFYKTVHKPLSEDNNFDFDSFNDGCK